MIVFKMMTLTDTHTHRPVSLSLKSSKQYHLVDNMSFEFLVVAAQGDLFGVTSQSLTPSVHKKLIQSFDIHVPHRQQENLPSQCNTSSAL